MALSGRLLGICLGLLAASLGVLIALTERGSRALAYPALMEQAQAADEEMPRPAGAAFARRALADGIYELTYSFRNFNEDDLELSFTIVGSEIEGSIKEFGWSKKELDAALRPARGDEDEKRKAAAYFASRGFRVTGKSTVAADVPLMVRRNARRLNGLAQVLAKESESRDYSSEDIVGAAAALVQTGVAYRIPPAIEGGRHIGGMFPPPKALAYGWGDCDTKTALLATLLSNWDGMRAVGLSLPRHYLMGIARVPRQGDAYVEHDGVHYVLIESAGPAWLPPGTVGRGTQDLLDAMDGVPIQPF